MIYKECIPMVHLRCTQTEVNKSNVQYVFNAILPKLDEAEAKLQRCGMSLESMYCAFNVDDVVEAAGDPDRMHLYPRPAPGLAAWSGVFNKILDGPAAHLTHAERLAVKMINYMVYTECVYANLVNQLCYVLVNSDSPQSLETIRNKTTMKQISLDVNLKPKVKFLSHNLPEIKPNSLSITDTCDINLRNMIAHGSLAGGSVPCTDQQKSKHQSDYSVYVRGGLKDDWKWCADPVNLDDAYMKIHRTTLIWHNALWCYWDMKFGPQNHSECHPDLTRVGA